MRYFALLLQLAYSGMSGSLPHIADLARCALAEPARLADAKGELSAALCVERYTRRSPTMVPTYRPSVPNTFSPLIRPTTFPERLYTVVPDTWSGFPFFVYRSKSFLLRLVAFSFISLVVDRSSTGQGHMPNSPSTSVVTDGVRSITPRRR